MSDHVDPAELQKHVKKYIIIGLLLIFFTAVTVALSYVELPTHSMNIIVGMIVVGAALIVEIRYQWPVWLHLLVWLPLSLAAVQRARHEVLKPYLKASHCAVGSINSPMQCMMKEICAQCLQPHKDPVTGKETVVFSCFNQDQLIDHVDFKNLNARLQIGRAHV